MSGDQTERPKLTPKAGFDGKDTVWLVRPVEAYGDPIDKLVLRRPTLKDLRQCGGMPFMMFTENERQFQAIDLAVIQALAARLAAVPATTIDALDFRDAAALTEAVTSFFAEPASPSILSTVVTMSPGDGESTPSASSRSSLMSSSSLNDRRSA